MGIAYLLQLLKNDVLVKIEDLSTWKKPGTCTIGVDGYNWMYKVLRSSSLTSGDGYAELGKKFMSKVSYLRRCGFTPYIVFDGAKLLVKNPRKGTVLPIHTNNLQLSNSNVTHEMVFSVIQELEHNNVTFVVAPYEADPQLAFLLKENHVDVILTGDSDLILYGCEKIIFDYKQNYYEYDFSSLERSKDFVGFTKEMVLQTCMLGGCDYLPNLPDVGLKSAILEMKKRMEMMGSVDDYLEILEALKPTGVNLKRKSEYIEKFIKAMNTYRHQRVYDPTHKTFVCLTPFPNETEEDQDYIGHLPKLPPNTTAEDFANGRIHPITKDRMKVPYSEVEVRRNVEMESFFRATSTLKVLQEAMLDKAQDHSLTQSRQISTDMKITEACKTYEADYNNDCLGNARASFRDMSHTKIEAANEYKTMLEEEVIKTLNGLIKDERLKDARAAAELYNPKCKNAIIEFDQEKLENLKQISRTSSLKTSEILVRMSELECVHCKKLAAILDDILAAILKETEV